MTQPHDTASRATPARTVGVLYPGELGAAVAAVLRGRGLDLVTTLGGRGLATARRCEDAGIVVLNSLADVVRRADVLVSLVPPGAAEDVAAAYCDLAHLAPSTAIYVDMNSIGPELSAALGERVERRGRGFVDAAINGLAKNLTTGGTLYLSGARAGEVAALFGGAVRTKVLGDDAGRASAMKMLLAGLSKGVCALFAELALVARHHDLLPELTEASAQIYPGIWALVERMLPTYALHAGRRAGEMRELEDTARGAGIEPCVVAAVRELHETLAGASFDAPGGGGAGGWSVASLIERLAEAQVLSARPMPGAAVSNAD